MTELTPREASLVALGAALASNCVPCVEHHVPLAKKNGLSDAEISAAIELADRIRQVPARKVLDAANSGLSAAAIPNEMASAGAGCADLPPTSDKRCC